MLLFMGFNDTEYAMLQFLLGSPKILQNYHLKDERFSGQTKRRMLKLMNIKYED